MCAAVVYHCGEPPTVQFAAAAESFGQAYRHSCERYHGVPLTIPSLYIDSCLSLILKHSFVDCNVSLHTGTEIAGNECDRRKAPLCTGQTPAVSGQETDTHAARCGTSGTCQ